MGIAPVQPFHPDLMQQAQGAASTQSVHRMRCGEVWGGGCKAWVQGPSWGHANHAQFRSPWSQRDRVFPASVPSFVLADLSNSDKDDIRAAIAQHQACPPQVRIRLCDDPSPKVRTAAWRTIDSAPLLLRALEQRDIAALAGVARNPISNSPMLRRVVQYKPPASVLASVAAHPQCPSDLLDRFSSLRNKTIVRGAARNPHCTAEHLAIMSTVHDYAVAHNIAVHPACTADILVDLSNQSWDIEHIHWRILEHPNCPPNLLARYIDVGNMMMIMKSIKHPNCPSAILEDAARSATQRQWVVQNPACPPHLLVQLLADTDPRIRGLVLDHPNLPEEYRALSQITK